MVGFAARDRVPVPVAGGRHWVDGADLPAGGAQARDKQPARGLDRHGDQVPGAVAVLSEQVGQLGQPGRVVADPAAGQQLPVPVHQGDVMQPRLLASGENAADCRSYRDGKNPAKDT